MTVPGPAASADEKRRIEAAAARAGVTVKVWVTAVVQSALEADERFHHLAPETRGHPSAAMLRHVQDGIRQATLTGSAPLVRLPRLR